MTGKQKYARDMKNLTKKNNPNYRHGRYCKQYFCTDCGKKIRVSSGAEGSIRCSSCATKYQCKNPENHPYWKGGLPKCADCQKTLGDRRSVRCTTCETIRKHREGILNISKEANPGWKDGKSMEKYGSDFTARLKNKVRLRDGY